MSKQHNDWKPQEDKQLKAWKQTAQADVMHINRWFDQNNVHLKVALKEPKFIEDFPIMVGRYGAASWYEIAPSPSKNVWFLNFKPATLTVQEPNAEVKLEPVIYRTPLYMNLQISRFLYMDEMLTVLPREINWRWERENKRWILKYLFDHEIISKKLQDELKFWWGGHYERMVDYDPMAGKFIHPQSIYALEELVRWELVDKFGYFNYSYILNGEGVEALEILTGKVEVLG